ncbi:MAG: hypothetical protein IJI57_11080 [Flexilinea sp.]|nr:hypothetical protein [Flexilinea sp.]
MVRNVHQKSRQNPPNIPLDFPLKTWYSINRNCYIVSFLQSAVILKDPGDRQNVDAVLTVSSSANYEAFENAMKRGEDMGGEAMRRLMEDVIQEENQKAVDKSTLTFIKNLMKNSGWDSEKAMNAIGISPADQIRYAALL